jgi:hypothetical protein
MRQEALSGDRTRYDVSAPPRVRGAAALILTAVVGNACCWLPPLLIAVGGMGAAWHEALGRFRPLFLVLMAVQLGFGFRNAYRSHADCCPAGDAGRTSRIRVMWGVAAVVLLLNVAPAFSEHRATTTSSVAPSCCPPTPPSERS